jgi:hypothetical protein
MAFQDLVQASPSDHASTISPRQPLLPSPYNLVGEPAQSLPLPLTQAAAHDTVTRKLRWLAKSERCAMIVALILTDVTISL